MADKPFFDKRGRLLPKRQLAAIFAKAERQGIPDTEINAAKLTSINDEIIAGRRTNEDENKVIDKALQKIFNVKPKVTKIDPALLSRGERKTIRSGQPLRVIDVIRKLSNSNDITHAEARRLLETSNSIPPGISDDAILQPSRKLAVTKKDDEAAIQEIVEKFDKAKKSEPILSKKVISKITPSKVIQRKISDAALRNALDKQRELVKTTKNLAEQTELLSKISDVQDKRADQQDARSDLLEKEIEKEQERKIEGGVKESPLVIPGLISGLDPLKVTTEQTVKDKIRRRALDIEFIEGKSPQEAMDQAKIEVVRQVTS